MYNSDEHLVENSRISCIKIQFLFYFCHDNSKFSVTFYLNSVLIENIKL